MAFNLDRWGSENGLKEKTIKVLKDEDLDTEMGLALLTNESIDKLGLTLGQTLVLKNLVNSKGKMPPSCPIEVRNLCKDACEKWIRNQDHYSDTSGIKINLIELSAEVETDVEAKSPSSLDASEFDEVSISSVDSIESLKLITKR